MWGRAFPEGWANTEFFCYACGVEQCPTPFLWLPRTWPRATHSCLRAVREQVGRGEGHNPDLLIGKLSFSLESKLHSQRGRSGHGGPAAQWLMEVHSHWVIQEL